MGKGYSAAASKASTDSNKSASPDEAFQIARKHQQRGNLKSAEDLYRKGYWGTDHGFHCRVWYVGSA